MKYLYSINESFWRKTSGVREPLFRGFSKKDMYIKTRRGEKKIGSSLNTSDMFAATEVQDINLTDEYRIDNWDISRNGVFKDDGNSYSFGSPNSGKIWYDFSHIFEKLRAINTKLGYNINSHVFVKPLNEDGRIVDIINFAFYERGAFMLYPKFTLIYKVAVNDTIICYQINQLDLVTNTNDDESDIKNFIRDNFIELSDDRVANLTISKFKSKGHDSFRCRVSFNEFNVDNLFKVTEQLFVAKNRLLSEGYNLNIVNISNDTLTFVVSKKLDM